MVELASGYGRYGYRKVTALLQDEGWRVNHKRIERLWRQEGLKVPKKQPKRKWLWLNDGSCVRLRPAYRDRVWSYDFVADRLSDHRYMANCFRMFLHSLANNLLVSLRQTIADPPADETCGEYLDKDKIPVEARTGRARRRHFNRRREVDPLVKASSLPR